jgi:hypothetical protein
VQVSFGTGSYLETEAESWTMWYPLPVPHAQNFTDEPGVHIHLEPTDASDVVQAIGYAVTAVGALSGPIDAVIGAFSGVVGILLARTLENSDGSMDIRFSQHGFQVGDVLPAGDPNVWIDGAWAPVAAALTSLGGAPPATAATVEKESMLYDGASPEVVAQHHGELKASRSPLR